MFFQDPLPNFKLHGHVYFTRSRSDAISNNSGGSPDEDTHKFWIRTNHLRPQRINFHRKGTTNHNGILAQKATVHQRVPRSAQTRRRNESPTRATRKHCLHPQRLLMTQRLPSPHHSATKNWRGRQHLTGNWMAAPRKGKQPSSLESQQLWSNRPHEQFKVGKMANTNTECHSSHDYICGSDPPSATIPASSSRLHYWKQLKQQEKPCTARINETRPSEYGYCCKGY